MDIKKQKHQQILPKTPDNTMKSAALQHSTSHEKGKELENASTEPTNVTHG